MKARAQSGNLTIMAGIAIVPLAMIVAMTSELASLSSERALMQSAADVAALSGAQDLTLVGSNARQTPADVEKFAMAQVGTFASRATVSFKASQGNDGSYTVEGLAIRSSFFGDLVPKGGFRIEVKSIAESMQVQPLCVIGDADTMPDGIAISAIGNSILRAQNCIVHSNSNFNLTGIATVEAGTSQAVGVATGTGFKPAANSGALKIDDPFKARKIEPPQTCASVPDGGTKTIVTGAESVTLKPGMHRTQYIVTGQATLTLEPGEHYFCKNLRIAGQGRLEGDDVLLMFTAGFSLQVTETGYVSLSGRQSGPWAGFVIVATRDNYANISFASGRVDKLLGTIYIPMARFIVGGSGDTAEGSQWSVIVARNINLGDNARLVINSDYAGSPVPVPTGVGNQAGGGANGPLRLRQ
ncbi:Putative Flp pilus-assembly TadG-like, N-terminal [Caulobacteraceae bacterium]